MTRTGLTLLLVLTVGCEGTISSSGVEPGAVPGSSVLDECKGVSERAGLAPRVRRLQANEYRNTLATLTGATPNLEFPIDPSPNGYVSRSDTLRVNAPLVELLWREMPAFANTTARTLVASSSCQSGEACARTLLSSFGARAYRRPLAAEELDDLLVVFTAGADGADFTSGISLALEVVFQSASMLFHTELGQNGRLTPYETAELLSYAITAAPPDAELSALAAAGPLDATTREAQARRLLATAASRTVLGDFGAQWLRVDHLGTNVKSDFPQWSALRGPALDETRTFVATAMLEDEPLRTLFTGDWTTADAALAAHYGATALSATRWKLPPARSGVLSHASVMATLSIGSESAPVQRGRLVRTRLLCQFKRFAPPADLKITLPPLDANATTRERFAAHSSNASCQGCHRFLDPIGFGFENFDAIGGFRETENGRPIDASGELVSTDIDGTFTGVRELGTRLADSVAARDCFAQNYFEFAMGQPLDEIGPPALCSLRDATRDFAEGELPMKAAILDIIRSDLFTARSP